MNKPTIVFLFVLLGTTLGLIFVLTAPAPPENQTIEWLDNPRNLARFNLESQMGAFDNRSLLGHWTIVLFGFLQCPDVCPTSLSELATLANDLTEDSLDKEVRLVFVSVDPDRDTISDVSKYAKNFSRSIEGVTGHDDQLTQFSDSLGIQFKVSPDRKNYSVAHSTTYSIIDPQGFLSGRFRPGFSASELVTDLAAILR